MPGRSLTLKLRQKDSRDPRELQVHLQICSTLVFRTPQALQPGSRLLVDSLAHAECAGLLMADVLEVAEEGAGGLLPHLLPGRAPHGEVGRDQADFLAIAVLGGE